MIRSIEIPGVGKVELQQRIDPESSALREQMKITVQMFDSHGFYTPDGLAHLIRDSGLVQSGEEVCEKLQIFRTRNQRTWFLATPRQVFCVLDDQLTKRSGRLIQWRMPLHEASPIRVHWSERGNPVVDVGPKQNWLYSPALHPDEAALETEISEMLIRAAGKAD